MLMSVSDESIPDDESFDDFDSLCLPSENEEMLCDSDDESVIDSLNATPINEIVLVSEAPFQIKMPLPRARVFVVVCMSVSLSFTS